MIVMCRNAVSRFAPATGEWLAALECLYKETKMNKHRDQQDKALEDSFPASDPPANQASPAHASARRKPKN